MFRKLFESYGYQVSEFEDSFVADNGVFCIFYTETEAFGKAAAAAVSFLSRDLPLLKKVYDGKDQIGIRLYNDYIENKLPCMHSGKICSQLCSITEMEWMLKHILA